MTSMSKRVRSRARSLLGTAAMMFTLTDRIGALSDVLEIFNSFGISLKTIESRPSVGQGMEYDFYCEFQAQSEPVLEEISTKLKEVCINVTLFQVDNKQSEIWFPRKIYDLDLFQHKVLSYGEELDSNHPGFTDEEYRKRRLEITAQSKGYQHGQPIPRIEYTKQETETWGIIYKKLTSLYKTHACQEMNYIFPLLEQNCGYAADNIPQLEDISRFLKECTGFTLRPVAGLLSSRDFLNGLAFRVFHSTQYIRHHSRPFYTPEPDVCHELLGHVPLFCDPKFAEFSQEIGLASLGASDEDIIRLATNYWFTVEFGLCRQNGELKAYGAGLLSSYGELEYCLSDKPELISYDPTKVASNNDYPVTQFQPHYYVADSFDRAIVQMREFAASLQRSFVPHYNPYTQSIEVLDSKERLQEVIDRVIGQLKTLNSCIGKVNLSNTKK